MQRTLCPSLNPRDLLLGVTCAAAVRTIVYFKGKNAKKYRHGVEYGSGKTRFHVKPNLMQRNCSYVVTDPKGTVVNECGKMPQRSGYEIKILNTINFKESMKYNPFRYLRSENDILKLVHCIMENTKGEDSKGGEDFWAKAEALYYQALTAYIWYGFSLDLQSTELRCFAEQAGFTIAGEAAEYGSGLTLDRAAFKEVTQAVNNDKVDIVLVKSVTRIARDMWRLQEYIDLLAAHGVSLYCVQEQVLFRGEA